ncbi:MAG: ABC transporter permease [Gaiellaceae bacterium]
MAVAEAQPEQRFARARAIGWRALGAFARRREASIAVVGLALIVYFSLRSSAFYEGDSIKNIAVYVAPLALIASGEVMLLICGEIDLSVGRVFALSPVIMYLTTAPEPDGLGLPIWLGVIFGLLAAAGVGLVNGIITTVLRVPSFITTLGMLFFLNGINLRALHGFQVETPGGSTFTKIFGGSPLWFNSEFWWALAVVIVLQIVLIRTRWGVHTVATGGNLIGASESGVNVRRVKIGNFVLCSMLGGFAGIMDSVRITSILPLQGGPDIMFAAVAAAVIGGTSLLGGSGTIIGGFLGVCVLGILNIGFTTLGVSAFNFDLIIGLAILGSMILNVQIQRLKNIGVLGRRAR